LAVTDATASTEIPTASNVKQYPFINLLNDGSDEIFVALGSSDVVATSSSIPIPAGKCLSLYIGAAQYVAAIVTVTSGTSTLRMTQSNGPACPR
jgi:hypothetical protein